MALTVHAEAALLQARLRVSPEVWAAIIEQHHRDLAEGDTGHPGFYAAKTRALQVAHAAAELATLDELLSVDGELPFAVLEVRAAALAAGDLAGYRALWHGR